MYCSKCGSPLKENAQFCTVCGSNILAEDIQNSHSDNDSASEPQAENPYDQQQALQKPYENNQLNCPKCGATLKENAQFCTVCGFGVLKKDIQNPHLDNNYTSEPQAENLYNQRQTFQKPYENKQTNYNQRSFDSNMFNSNTAFKVISGVLVVLLLWKTAEHISLKRQISEYENRDAVEKTIDAGDSWFDSIKNALPDSLFGF